MPDISMCCEDAATEITTSFFALTDGECPRAVMEATINMAASIALNELSSIHHLDAFLTVFADRVEEKVRLYWEHRQAEMAGMQVSTRMQ